VEREEQTYQAELRKMNNGNISKVAADKEVRFGCKGGNKFSLPTHCSQVFLAPTSQIPPVLDLIVMISSTLLLISTSRIHSNVIDKLSQNLIAI
jgi:hypothetical protein